MPCGSCAFCGVRQRLVEARCWVILVPVDMMKIALVQMNTTVGDIHGNRDAVFQAMARAEQLGADMAVFPELCLTGYPPRDLLEVRALVDANLAALQQLAGRTGRMAAVVGYVDRNLRPEGKELYNAAAFLHEGAIRSVVHKTLLPTYDVFDEERYFERAPQSRLVSFQGRTLGISICEDAWNDQDFWSKRRYHTDPIRNQVQQGADLLINLSSSPFEIDKPLVRYRMLLGHVRKYRVPLVYVNLVGGNDDLLFDGNSLAIGKQGNLIAQGKSFAEDLFLVDPDSVQDQGYREGEAIRNLFDVLVMGTRDYARKCGFKSAVLGLSGGIDSAVTACVAAAAFGPQNVLGVSMPSVYSAQESHDDARSLAENLGIGFRVVPIGPAFEAYKEMLAPVFAELPEDTTEENLQARVRGNILMALSNKFGHLVLSTGNKSELGVGYCTLYGDMAGGLAVISDVPKTMVYQLATCINREREVIPAHTVTRAPSAELRPNQTDQETLPPYEILDAILHLVVEEQCSVNEVVRRGYDRTMVEWVTRKVYASAYKRQQAAPGLKVTSRAFGTGRRMPIAMKPGF
jgi:NAD+ synthase (glutamine-hydrolysing)